MTEEIKDDAKVEKKSDKQRLDELSATVGAIQSEMKRHSDNWKRHMMKFHDSMSGGAAAIMFALGLSLVFGQTTFAADRIVDEKKDRANTTIYQLTTDDAGKGNLIVTGTISAEGTQIVVSASTTNLVVTGSITNDDAINAGGDVNVASNLAVTGTTALTGDTTITGVTAINGGLTVDTTRFEITDTTGAWAARGAGTVSALSVTGDATFVEEVLMSKTLSVVGNTTLTGTVRIVGATDITGATKMSNTLAVAGNTTVGGTLGVVGVATFTAAPVLTSIITTGTNTMLITSCPGPLVTNTPIWFKITSTNGTSYYVPGVVSP